ncbi:MAG: hypothetical protein N3A68_07775 [Bacteroidia bacterium]|nr:hypothetical protein [Bacteroidia bacterium]
MYIYFYRSALLQKHLSELVSALIGPFYTPPQDEVVHYYSLRTYLYDEYQIWLPPATRHEEASLEVGFRQTETGQALLTLAEAAEVSPGEVTAALLTAAAETETLQTCLENRLPALWAILQKHIIPSPPTS